MNKKKRFKQIVKGIKNIEIQGARNIAKKALYAYSLIPTQKSKKKLLSLRPTEPMLEKVLDLIHNQKKSYKEILNHFRNTQDKINKNVFKLIKNKDVVFTHCHSSNVVEALIYTKKHKKKFEVYNTETRPLFQGRKTLSELKKAKIPVTQFIDSAAMVALTKRQGTKRADKVFLGADALLKKGVINKVGSGMFARIAYDNKIPVYIIADSWKFTKKPIELEQRSPKEIWNKIKNKTRKSKNKLKESPIKISIKNPSFEFVAKTHIKAIITELGIMRYDLFLKKVR